MEPLDVGARVDHRDLVRGHAGRDEVALDRLTHGDDRVHAPTRIPEAARPGHPEADATVQDEARARPQEPGQQCQGARPPLVRVRHLDVAGADQPRDTKRRADVPGAPHGDRDVGHAGRAEPLGPERIRRRRHGDGVAARGEAGRQVAQLDRRAGEVIRFRVQLEDPERYHAPKNARTAVTTRSISPSAWSAEIGSERISSTSRSVRGSGGGAKRSTAAWRWVGTG